MLNYSARYNTNYFVKYDTKSKALAAAKAFRDSLTPSKRLWQCSAWKHHHESWSWCLKSGPVVIIQTYCGKLQIPNPGESVKLKTMVFISLYDNLTRYQNWLQITNWYLDRCVGYVIDKAFIMKSGTNPQKVLRRAIKEHTILINQLRNIIDTNTTAVNKIVN